MDEREVFCIVAEKDEMMGEKMEDGGGWWSVIR